jgi:hypothetical protein
MAKSATAVLVVQLLVASSPPAESRAADPGASCQRGDTVPMLASAISAAEAS